MENIHSYSVCPDEGTHAFIIHFDKRATSTKDFFLISQHQARAPLLPSCANAQAFRVRLASPAKIKRLSVLLSSQEAVVSHVMAAAKRQLRARDWAVSSAAAAEALTKLAVQV